MLIAGKKVPIEVINLIQIIQVATNFGCPLIPKCLSPHTLPVPWLSSAGKVIIGMESFASVSWGSDYLNW